MSGENNLIDAETGEERFRAQGLVASGRHYQIVLGEVIGRDGGAACARAILYDVERLEDRAYVEGRHRALDQMRRFLSGVDSDLLPEPIAHFETSSPETGFEREPVVVTEFVEGETLFEWLRREHPEGLEVERALGLFRSIVQFLVTAHGEGYVYRDLDPRHVIVDGDGELQGMVGFGNATKMKERPNPHVMDFEEAPYVAPEVRAERSGGMLKPSADVYALGALLSFMLTGEEPRSVVENPLSWPAYERLSNLEPPGAALLVARCIRPLAKNRFGRLERLLPYTTPDGLPTPDTDGFGMLHLPAPFSGVEEPDENRALKSNLSSGPLISVSSDDDDEPETPDDGMPLSWTIGALVLAILSVVALIALGVI